MKHSWMNRLWSIVVFLLCILGIIFLVLPLIDAGYQYYYGADEVYLISGNVKD